MKGKQEETLHFWVGELSEDKTFPMDKAKMRFEEGKKMDGYLTETKCLVGNQQGKNRPF